MQSPAILFAMPVVSLLFAAPQPQRPPATAVQQSACTPQQALEAEQRQDFQGAIRIYTCLKNADPHDWRPVASIAGVYGVLNQSQQEQEWAQRAIAIAPNQPGPYINLGNAQATLNNIAGARVSFQKALDVAPTSSVGAYSLGVLADTQHNLQEAEQWYRRALAIQPRDENAAVSLAALLGNSGRVQQAIPLLQRVLADDPQAEDAKQMLDAMQRSGTGSTPAGGAAPIQRR